MAMKDLFTLIEGQFSKQNKKKRLIILIYRKTS